MKMKRTVDLGAPTLEMHYFIIQNCTGNIRKYINSLMSHGLKSPFSDSIEHSMWLLTMTKPRYWRL